MFYKVGKPWKHYTKWKRPDTKDDMQYHLYQIYRERQIYRDRKESSLRRVMVLRMNTDYELAWEIFSE